MSDNEQEERYPVMHDRGEGACGGVVFYFKRRISPGEILAAKDVVYVDGTPAKANDVVRCGTCNATLVHFRAFADENGVYHAF